MPVEPLVDHRLCHLWSYRPQFSELHEWYAEAASYDAAGLLQTSTVDEDGGDRRHVRGRPEGNPSVPDVEARSRCRKRKRPHLKLCLVHIWPGLYRQGQATQRVRRGRLELAVEIPWACALGVKQLAEQAHRRPLRNH